MQLHAILSCPAQHRGIHARKQPMIDVASLLLMGPVIPLTSQGKMMHCKHSTLRPV